MANGPAIVVGSGPNGLAAAIELAKAGYRVTVYEAASTAGGGSRTLELIEPGHLHDVCAAAHPLGAASPYFSGLNLGRHGLEWITSDVAVSHPLGNGRATALYNSLDDTVDLLQADGAAYRKLIEPILARFERTVAGSLSPLQEGWRRPVTMARFGLTAIRSITSLAKRFETAEGKALLAGLGAHSIARLDAATTAGVGLLLAAAAHVVGWPIAKSGSQSIIDALVGELEAHGGNVVTNHEVESLSDVDRSTPVFFDTAPAQALAIGGDRIRRRRPLQRWRHGPGSHKVDWILRDPIPWQDQLSPRAATVHLGGSFEEIVASEAAAVAGQAPTNPFAIITQPSLFDNTRAPAGRHIGWGYCHVPAGFSGDVTDVLEAQVERFAPGFRDTIVSRHVHTAQGLERYNVNYVGGDIAGGALNLRQLLMRPRLAPNPYRIGSGIYLCSASAPPGAGVHGMSGYHAARRALRDLS